MFLKAGGGKSEGLELLGGVRSTGADREEDRHDDRTSDGDADQDGDDDPRGDALAPRPPLRAPPSGAPGPPPSRPRGTPGDGALFVLRQDRVLQHVLPVTHRLEHRRTVTKLLAAWVGKLRYTGAYRLPSMRSDMSFPDMITGSRSHDIFRFRVLIFGGLHTVSNA